MRPQAKRQIVAERAVIDGDVTVSIASIAALEWAKKELSKFSDDSLAKHFLKDATDVPYLVRSMHISPCFDIDEVLNYLNAFSEDDNVLTLGSIQDGPKEITYLTRTP